MSTTRAELFLSRNRDMAERVLAHMRELHQAGCAITTSILGDRVGYSGRHCYNYLRALQVAEGVVALNRARRRWEVVG